MKLRIGYELEFECENPTPMILHLAVHRSRVADLREHDLLQTDPPLAVRGHRDEFGNSCHRTVLPSGRTRLHARGVIHDSGRPDPVDESLRETPVDRLPTEVLGFLLGSRYCETDLLADFAWARFRTGPSGWGRVQAICDFVHDHVEFDYEHARPTRTAAETLHEGRGVCRDFAHLAVALCRCMNIPARYCTGYLSHIGEPEPWAAMDFAGWFEAFLDGAWHTFDPRFNTPRIGRVLIARGRDANDVAISTAFGPNLLERFGVIAEALPEHSSRGQVVPQPMFT
jgi:transglutaminase-like putative cysteine protease